MSFVQFSLICSKFRILSKTECKSIYYHFRRDHASSSFEKPVRRECISQKTQDFFSSLIYFISHQFNKLNEITFNNNPVTPGVAIILW